MLKFPKVPTTVSGPSQGKFYHRQKIFDESPSDSQTDLPSIHGPDDSNSILVRNYQTTQSELLTEMKYYCLIEKPQNQMIPSRGYLSFE